MLRFEIVSTEKISRLFRQIKPTTTEMGIELYYHPQSPPSGSLRMLLKELGLEFKEHMIDFFTGQHKSDEFKKINPHMQVPVLKDGDTMFYER